MQHFSLLNLFLRFSQIYLWSGLEWISRELFAVIRVFVCASTQPNWLISPIDNVSAARSVWHCPDNFVSDQCRGGWLLSTKIRAHENMDYESWEMVCDANTNKARNQMPSWHIMSILLWLNISFSCLAGLPCSGINAQDETCFTFIITITLIIPLIFCST